MRKALLIWWQTYRRSVLHPAFLMFTLGVPGFLLFLGGAAGYFVLKATEGDTRPVGIVDTAHLLIPAEAWTPNNQFQKIVNLKTLGSEAEAQAALRAATIQAYFVVRPDYVTSGAVTEVSAGEVSDRVHDQLRGYLTEGLLKATPAERRTRLAQGATVLHRSLTDQRELSLQLAFQWGLVAFVLVAFYLINSSSTSDMLHALREEKEKRTIEISLTSVTVEQLLVGKVGGIVSAGLTQFAVWLAGAGLAAAITWQVLHLGGITLTAGPLVSTLALCVALLLPAYIMSATGVIVISSMADLAGQGEQIVSLLTNLVGTLAGPLAFTALSSPDNPLAVVLSILPVTSPLLMVTRYVQVEVPAWQIVLSIGLVWSLMVFNVLVAARVYRATWLMMGERHWARVVWQAMLGR